MLYSQMSLNERKVLDETKIIIVKWSMHLQTKWQEHINSSSTSTKPEWKKERMKYTWTIPIEFAVELLYFLLVLMGLNVCIISVDLSTYFNSF